MKPIIGDSKTTEGTIAVVVTYVVHSGMCDDFVALSTEHAIRTLEEEGGRCLRYDVVAMHDDSVVFYELYESQAAFEEHASSEYLAEFRLHRSSMLKTHETRVGRLVCPATLSL